MSVGLEAEKSELDTVGDRPRVYILARKILLQNTRIFKQARSLSEAGYEVTVIGILPRGGLERERRDGYEIIRLRLDPLYARVPRRIRHLARVLNKIFVRAPFRLALRVLRIRLVFHRALRSVRRAAHLARFHVSRSRRAIARAARRRIDSDDARRLARLRLLRRWQILRYRIASLGASDPYVEAEREALLKRLLVAPIVLVARALRLIAAGTRAVFDAIRYLRERRLGYALLRGFVRLENSVLRTLTELAVRVARALLRPVAWPLKSVEFYKQAHRTLTGELPSPDVIHANDLDTLWVASVLARRYAVPLVYDAQELYTGIHTLPRLYRSVLTVQEWVLIRRAQRTLAVNDAIRDVMERRYKVKIDAVVLNCPPLVEDLGDGRSLTVRQLFDLPDEVTLLLYSGALGPQRGIESTIESLHHLPDACLVLLGEGPIRGELEELAYDAGLEDRVLFAPFVHHLDVPSFISSADIGVIPYRNVGINHYLCSPSKLFHYIMAGLPIACSDFPFLRKVVLENGIGAVFDPDDPRSIAAAIDRLTDPPRAYAECKQRLQLARRTYCWEEQEKLFMSVYRSLPGDEINMPAVDVRTAA